MQLSFPLHFPAPLLLWKPATLQNTAGLQEQTRFGAPQKVPSPSIAMISPDWQFPGKVTFTDCTLIVLTQSSTGKVLSPKYLFKKAISGNCLTLQLREAVISPGQKKKIWGTKCPQGHLKSSKTFLGRLKECTCVQDCVNTQERSEKALKYGWTWGHEQAGSEG